MKRFEVWVVNLDPTIGSEIRKTRPAVIVSPDELNANISLISHPSATLRFRCDSSRRVAIF